MEADDRNAFAPPHQPGLVRGIVLAIVAHLLLVAALTFGLRWERDAQEVSAAAELWAAVPQEAAPQEAAPPTRPEPQPEPPKPEPQPAPPPPPPPPEVQQREAEIALEREKQKQAEEEARRQAELERERKRREEAEKRKREEEAARKEAERKREEAEKKAAEARAAAEKKRKEEAERKKREQEEERRLAKLREENLRRIQGLAGGGTPDARGTAAHSAGPSASWAGQVRAAVRPNIVFAEDYSGSPSAEVEVRMAADGSITSRRLVKSSGHPGWDLAVLRALDKTAKLPLDKGRVHSPVILTFRPRD